MLKLEYDFSSDSFSLLVGAERFAVSVDDLTSLRVQMDKAFEKPISSNEEDFSALPLLKTGETGDRQGY
jgi:hypothetical protein